MGLDLIRYRRARFARQVASSALFTALIFSMVIFNLSFGLTLQEARNKLDTGGGPIIITPDEIRFMEPPDRWVWNATQAVIDNATLSLANKLGAAFTAITLIVTGLTFWHETAKAYGESKRDNEEYGATMGTMYALGAPPGRIYAAFMAEKALPYSAGFALGLLASYWLIIPLLLDGFHLDLLAFQVEWAGIRNTIASLFFRRFEYLVAGAAAGTFVFWIATIKSLVLGRAMRHRNLQDATRESS
jgi:hypothetical protein